MKNKINKNHRDVTLIWNWENVYVETALWYVRHAQDYKSVNNIQRRDYKRADKRQVL